MKKIIDMFLDDRFDITLRYLNYGFFVFDSVLCVLRGNFEGFFGYGLAVLWCHMYFSTRDTYKKHYEDAMEGWRDSNDLLSEIIKVTKINEH